jgi:GTP-binding protein LepA
MSDSRFIRNFSIIAHVDHGKSTLSDRIIQLCHGIEDRLFHDQFLDSMDLEREKGITIKAQTIRLYRKYEGETYIFNLIDTPGHVDFSYEVSRALAGCETSILLVDATKGVEAQTISNLHKARQAGHFIIPVINKIDLPSADLDNTLNGLKKWGIDTENVFLISAKSGEGVDTLLDYIITKAPSPVSEGNKFRALIMDSWYDKYLGVVALVRIKDGNVKKNTELKTFSNNQKFLAAQVGIFESAKMTPEDILEAGEIGYIVTQLKNPDDIRVGDTVSNLKDVVEQLPGFKDKLNTVFCTFYVSDNMDVEQAHEALKKMRLNDPSFVFEVESSKIHGIGFRCGFHGLLHLETIQERIFREFEVSFMATMPSVVYRVTLNNGKVLEIKNPTDLPSRETIKQIEEPETLCSIFTPNVYLGRVLELINSKRGINIDTGASDEVKSIISANIPLGEIITNFSDQLYSISSGYASFDYNIIGHRTSDLVKLEIVINECAVDEFTTITHKSHTRAIGLDLVEKLKEIIPRGQLLIKIQASCAGQIIARADIKPYRKDVIAHCSGGHVDRKNKLLDKQKKGKEKLYNISKSVMIPTDAFVKIFKINK